MFQNIVTSIAIAERNIWGGSETVLLTEADRRCHTYILGKTGSGKSTLLRNILVQEIEQGRGVGLLDPHGDLAEELLELISSRRINDVIYFHPADVEHPFAWNVLRGGATPDRVTASLVSALKNIWRDSWGPRLEYILYASIRALVDCQNASLLGVPRLLTDETYRQWVIRQIKDQAIAAFWRNEFAEYDVRFRNEAISPVLNKIGQFAFSPIIRNILGQIRSEVDFRQVLDRRQVFIANLSKAQLGEEHCSLLGSLLVSQFQLAAMARADVAAEERADFHLAIDECHNFITGSFATILSEARKYGLHLILLNQYLDQLRPEMRQAIMGNVGALMAFRVGHLDARDMAEEFGTVAAETLASLPRFEMVAKLTLGSLSTEPFYATTLAPLGHRHNHSARIKARCRERFCSERSRVAARLDRWQSRPAAPVRRGSRSGWV